MPTEPPSGPARACLGGPGLARLAERVASGEAVVGGVLSGTSADGIDVGLARFVRRGGALALSESLAFSTEPFPAELGARVREVLDGVPADLRTTALLHRDLGRAFGAAVAAVARRAGLAPELVGSHGQTVYHHDGREPSGAATLQLGDGDFVAEAAGCAVVSDFRQRDVAAGGGGAPLSAYADDLLFASAPRPLAVANLGGMANLSWIDGERVLAYDTGPAGALLDGLARRLLDRPFDAGGAAASAGRADPSLVRVWLAHPFFAEPPPKSTGRDTFGEAWIDACLAGARGRAEDLLASAVELVAASVAGALRWLPAAPPRVWLAGGGVRNRALVSALERALPTGVDSSAAAGVDPDGREALVFAALAARWIAGEGVTRPGATGAARGRVLGKLSPPPEPGPDSAPESA